MWTNRKSSSKYRNYSEEPNGTCTKTKTQNQAAQAWSMTNSLQYFIFILSGTFFVCLSWCLKLFQKLLIKNVPTNILNSNIFKIQGQKKKKKAFSSKICDHDRKMKGWRFLHSLAAVFAYGELAYEPTKKDNFNQKYSSYLQ